MQLCYLHQSHKANLPPSFFVVKKVFAIRRRREGFFFSGRGGESVSSLINCWHKVAPHTMRRKPIEEWKHFVYSRFSLVPARGAFYFYFLLLLLSKNNKFSRLIKCCQQQSLGSKKLIKQLKASFNNGNRKIFKQSQINRDACMSRHHQVYHPMPDRTT